MENKDQELNCVKCKTRIFVEVNGSCQDNNYRLIFCPTCNTPLREIRAVKGFRVETTVSNE